MNLTEIKDKKEYEVKSFGKLKREQVEIFNEQGLIEGEIISIEQDIKKSKNTIIIINGETTYAINKKYAKEIVVI